MDAVERDSLVNDNVGLVSRVIATKFKSLHISSNRYDIAYSDGLVGLWAAAKTWNGSGKFRTWALSNIYWKILNGFRHRRNYKSEHQAIGGDSEESIVHVDPLAMEPLEALCAAGLLEFARRYCGREWPVVLELLRGGSQRSYARDSGINWGTVFYRMSCLRKELSANARFMRELES